MTKQYADELIEWADKTENTDFSKFVRLMQEAIENGYCIKTECGKTISDKGKLTHFHIAYNRKFPDMDLVYRQENWNYSLCFLEITKQHIKREGEVFHIINTQGGLDGYITVYK